MSRILLLAASLLLAATVSNGQKKSTPYVILISFDGFRFDYVEKFNTPNFKALIRDGAASEGLIPSFPSKTFPNHYTLVTGLYPGNHGLVDNYFYDPSTRRKYAMSDTLTTRDAVFYGGTPIWTLAQQQGLRTASYFWVGSEAPVKGRYPDYFFHYKESDPDEKRVDQAIAWLQLPENTRPNFISLYFSLVDTESHDSGPESEATKLTVLKADSVLGMLMTKLKKVDFPVNVIVVSDHGMLTMNDDAEFFITLTDLLDLKNPSTVVVNGGTQAHIYTNNVDSVYAVLKKKEDHFKVYKRSEMPAQWHYDNPRAGDILLAAKPGFYIQLRTRASKIYGGIYGAHGFDPAVVKEMRGIFYASGPNIKKGTTVKAFENIHVYPFIAKILGLTTPDIDGDVKVLEGIYKK